MIAKHEENTVHFIDNKRESKRVRRRVRKDGNKKQSGSRNAEGKRT